MSSDFGLGLPSAGVAICSNRDGPSTSEVWREIKSSVFRRVKFKLPVRCPIGNVKSPVEPRSLSEKGRSECR